MAPRTENVVWTLMSRRICRGRRVDVLFWIAMVAFGATAGLMVIDKPLWAFLPAMAATIALVFLMRDIVRPAMELGNRTRAGTLREDLAQLPISSNQYTSAFMRLFAMSAALGVVFVGAAISLPLLNGDKTVVSGGGLAGTAALFGFVLMVGWGVYWPAVLGGWWRFLPGISVLSLIVSPFLAVVTRDEGAVVGMWISSGVLAGGGIAAYVVCRKSFAKRLVA